MKVWEYNTCVNKFSDNIYRFLLKNVKSEDKAKDLVQDTFLKLWLKVKDIDFEKAKSFLFTTAYRLMIDLIRREKKQGDFNDIDEPYHHEQYSDVSELLQEALGKLPETQRSVVLLRDYEGYSYKEIGEITDLSEAQVKVYIYRARKSLKKWFNSLEKVV